MRVRAFLVDPEKRAITEIEVEVDCGEIQKLIGCHYMTSGSRPLRGKISTGFDTLYVSDDMLEDGDNPRFWFQVDADSNPPSSYPIPGRGVVIGVDAEGETCSPKIGLPELERRITFTQRKFRGFETFTGKEARARGADFVVELKAAIIDGPDEQSN